MVFNSAITSWLDNFKTLPSEEKETNNNSTESVKNDIDKLKSCETKNEEYEKHLKKLKKNIEKKERKNIKLKLKLDALKTDLKFSEAEKLETLKQLKKIDKKNFRKQLGGIYNSGLYNRNKYNIVEEDPMEFNIIEDEDSSNFINRLLIDSESYQSGGIVSGFLQLGDDEDDEDDEDEEEIKDNTKKKRKKKYKNKKKGDEESAFNELENDDGTDLNWITNSGVYCHKNYTDKGKINNTECRTACIESVGCSEYAIHPEFGCRIGNNMKKCCPESMDEDDKNNYCYKGRGWNEEKCPEETCKLFKLKHKLGNCKKKIHEILGGYRKLNGGEENKMTGNLEKLKMDLDKMEQKYVDCENTIVDLRYERNRDIIEMKYKKDKSDKQLKILGEQVKQLQKDLRLKTAQFNLCQSKQTGGHKCVDYSDSGVLILIGIILCVYIIWYKS